MDKVVLVTGASGLLGRAVLRNFEEAGWKGIGLAFSRANRNHRLIKVDLRDATAVADLIAEKKPSVIVHCAAEKSPDIAEKQQQETEAINVTATENLAKLAVQNQALLIYISTDSVFDGLCPPYAEDAAETSPINFYGKTKLAGEHVALANNGLVLRIPFLYGPADDAAESSLLTLYKQLEETHKQILISNYDYRYPTHVDDVAQAVIVIATAAQKNSSCGRVFHYAGGEGYTKYQMARLLGTVFNKTSDHLMPDNEPPVSGANRPQDPRLSCERLNHLNAPAPRSFAKNVRPVIEQFAANLKKKVSNS